MVHYAGRGADGDTESRPSRPTAQFQARSRSGKMMVDVSHTGQPVYIGDLANVERVYKDPTQYARSRGERGDPALGGDAGRQQHRRIRQRRFMQPSGQLQTTLPPDVKMDFVADQPRVVSERVKHFIREFGIAIVSVILVTMVLLPFRVALVSAVAIPVTISATFGVLNASASNCTRSRLPR